MTHEEIIEECWEWIYWHSHEYLYKDAQGVSHYDSLGAADACEKHLENLIENK